MTIPAYFDSKKNVDEYIRMAEGYDGKYLISKLKKHLPTGSHVLELGMGPGKDLKLLQNDYIVTGSDTSHIFLNRYKEAHPDADLLFLDAASLNTTRQFECLYSNKVYHHLSQNETQNSFVQHTSILSDQGIALHTFWFGEGEEEHHGLRFVYYSEDDIKKLIPPSFKILELSRYTELDPEDSIILLMQKV
jgi:cyclopropane fatty-acyl-phospholipid synthase-like methyltransferase